MKLIILLIATLISGLAHANDLTVVASDITCVGKKEMGLLKYRVGIVVKNTGKENLILITKFDGAGLFNKEQIFFLDAGANSFDGTMIIPPKSDLGLVELYPEEGAEINGFLHSSKPLKGELIISYEVRDSYNGRYKNWEGIVKAKPTSINAAKKCAL
jgi:hypothetical protein